MFSKSIAIIGVAALLSGSIAGRAAADGKDLLGGLIVGGVAGYAIGKDQARKQQQQARPAPVYRDSYTVQQNREVQTSLNYFGFPAGTPDGVLGGRSRSAIGQYQAYMGYPSTGYLNDYERDFLVTSHQRALAGGGATQTLIAQNPQGVRGLLQTWRDEAAGVNSLAAAPAATSLQPAQPAPVMAAADPALPNLMGAGAGAPSLASYCNGVSLVTNTNGGFVTAANMGDPSQALGEQFCLARTYAIAGGEDLAARVPGGNAQAIAQQCAAFGPVMAGYVSDLSVKPRDAVLSEVAAFSRTTGMAPQQLAGTARICLGTGYRTDDMQVAVGSALLLTALGEQVYGELLGHHLALGFGAVRRPDLSMAWYDMGLGAAERGMAAFAPGQPERTGLIRQAAMEVSGTGGAGQVQPVSALPSFGVQ